MAIFTQGLTHRTRVEESCSPCRIDDSFSTIVDASHSFSAMAKERRSARRVKKLLGDDGSQWPPEADSRPRSVVRWSHAARSFSSHRRTSAILHAWAMQPGAVTPVRHHRSYSGLAQKLHEAIEKESKPPFAGDHHPASALDHLFKWTERSSAWGGSYRLAHCKQASPCSLHFHRLDLTREVRQEVPEGGSGDFSGNP